MQPQPFRSGDVLRWSVKENDRSVTYRTVSFIEYRGTDAAVVGWGLNRDNGQLARYTAALSELSRPEPPQPDLRFLPTPRRAPQRLTIERIQQRLLDARAKLRQAHEFAASTKTDVVAAKAVADRAASELTSAQAGLRQVEQHDQSRQREIEAAIQENRQPNFKSNGVDRSEITARVDALEAAKTKFDAALANATLKHAEAVKSVQQAARGVLSQMVAQAAQTLWTIEAVSARLRTELNAVAAWRPKGSLDLLHLDEQTANYIASPVLHYSEHPEARLSPSAWTRNWQTAYEELLSGNVDYQFPADSLPRA